MKPIINGCLRCKNERWNGHFESHIHYCIECVKYCETCGSWYTLENFHPKKDSSEYTTYLTLGGMSGRYLMKGQHNFHDGCKNCFPFPQGASTIRQELESLLASELAAHG